MTGAFKTWASIYRNLGFRPRPVKPGTKSPPMPRWQLPNAEHGDEVFARWIRQYGAFGIGLVMGSPISDGTTLGAFDVDRDEYHGLAKVPRIGGGGPLLYWNFRRRVWVSTLKKLDLPVVTPHSARHSFISTLQAQGIEVGLVAKIAGHSNANVTLGHYTQAVRGGDSAAIALEGAFGY